VHIQTNISTNWCGHATDIQLLDFDFRAKHMMY